MSSPGGAEVGRVSVRVLPDVSDFRGRLRRELESATAGLEARVGVNVDLDTAGVRARMRAMMAELRGEAARGVDINVGIDRRGVLGGFGTLSEQLDAVGRSADFGSQKIFGLTRVGWIMVAVFTLAAPAISLVASLLAGLPSLVAAAGAGAAAVALGFEGIKNAASGLSEPIQGLKDVLSARFENNLTPIFDRLAGVIPNLEGGMLRVADGVSDLAKGFLDVVTSVPGVANMNAILANTGQLFSDMRPFVTDMTAGLMTLATEGSRSFGFLSNALNVIGDQFNNVVTRLAATGAIEGAMRGLSEVLIGVGDAFNRMFAAGVEQMDVLGPSIRTALGGLTDLIVALMPPLAALSANLFDVIGKLGQELAPVIERLTPGFVKFTDLLGTALIAALDKIGPMLQPIAESLSNMLLVLVDKLGPKLPEIIESFGNLAIAIGDMFAANGPQMVENFTSLIQALTDATPAIITLLGVLPPLVGFISQLVGWFSSLAPLVTNSSSHLGNFGFALQGLGFVAPTVVAALNIIKGVIALFPQAFEMAKQAVSDFIGILSGAWETIKQGATDAWNTVYQTAVDAWNNLKQAVSDAMQGIVDAFTGMGGDVRGVLSGLAGDMAGIGVQIIQGLINGIMSMAGSVASAAAGVVRGAIDAAKGALGIHSPSKVFAEFGRYSAVGYINGLEGEAGKVEQSGDKFGNSVKESLRKQVPTISQAWEDALKESKLGEVPQKFLEATGKGILDDIGIKTDGALGNLVKQVTEYHTSNAPTYIVNDLDEAQRKERQRQQKESLQYTRR